MNPPEGTQTAEENVETYCYGHPDRPTKLQCTRCDRYICGQCAIQASVGQHCPECVAEARKSAPKVRTAMAVNAPVTRAIIALTVAVYVVELFGGNEFVNRFTSLAPAIADGEVYRLLTSVFLHLPLSEGGYAIMHIVFNMYILSIYGAQVEQLFGSARYAFLYLATGFFASAASYGLQQCSNGLGASGAVFGIVGVLMVYLYNRRSSRVVDPHLQSLWLFVLINLALGFTIARIDNIAHIGGLVSGAALAFGFDRGRLSEPKAPAPLQIATAVVVLVIGAGLVVQRTGMFELADCFR
ncbi:MAG TPA: rhomboid family intramembrane serine protease [Actinomycetota bacterium]|nr:rhomboid family intramembrane serine protease [Actinomycetota bacterium]